MRLLPLPGVFQPRSDSLLLAAHLRGEPLATSVLDLCTGSGLLALVAAQRDRRRVVAVDVSRRAVAAVRINAMLNGVRVHAVRGDLFSAVARERFDLIVSNPPYVPSPRGEIPAHGAARAWEAGPRGRTFIDRICAGACQHLNPGGVLLLVHSSVCDEHATLDALAARGLQARVIDRRRGPLGPLLRARVSWLHGQGLLPEGDHEEMVVVRAVA